MFTRVFGLMVLCLAFESQALAMGFWEGLKPSIIISASPAISILEQLNPNNETNTHNKLVFESAPTERQWCAVKAMLAGYGGLKCAACIGAACAATRNPNAALPCLGICLSSAYMIQHLLDDCALEFKKKD